MTTRHRPMATTIRLMPARSKVRRRSEPCGLLIAFAFGLLALAFDSACYGFKGRGQKRQEALSVGAAHIASGLAVSLPAAPFVQVRKRFVALAALSAVVIDLDHVV